MKALGAIFKVIRIIYFMDDSKFNKYKVSYDLLNNVMGKAIDLCHEMKDIDYICKECDNLIKDEINKSYKKLEKGIMMPTCISRNKVVCHCNRYEDCKLKEGDILRIEMACHIDYNVSSLGKTIKVGDVNWESNLLNAAKAAMKLGIQKIEPGLNLQEFKKVLEKVAKCNNVYLLKRPDVYHDIDTEIFFDWCHRDWERYNEPSWVVKYEHELELDEQYIDEEEIEKNNNFSIGEAYHLIVGFTNSEKKCKVSDIRPCLYQNTKIKSQLKIKSSREMISKVNKNFDKLLFNLEDIPMELTGAKIGARECTSKGVLRNLGVVELDSEIVILKCTVIVQRNSVYVLDKELDIKTENFSNELKELSSLPKKFDLRETI